MKGVERIRLFEICYRSKTGRFLNKNEMEFIRIMHEQHPEEYSEVHSMATKKAESEINPFVND